MRETFSCHCRNFEHGTPRDLYVHQQKRVIYLYETQCLQWLHQLPNIFYVLVHARCRAWAVFSGIEIWWGPDFYLRLMAWMEKEWQKVYLKIHSFFNHRKAKVEKKTKCRFCSYSFSITVNIDQLYWISRINCFKNINSQSRDLTHQQVKASKQTHIKYQNTQRKSRTETTTDSIGSFGFTFSN